jgi:hypothetical protein
MERNDEVQVDHSIDVMHLRLVETTTLAVSPSIAFGTYSLKTRCLMWRPAIISLPAIKKIGQGPMFFAYAVLAPDVRRGPPQSGSRRGSFFDSKIPIDSRPSCSWY